MYFKVYIEKPKTRNSQHHIEEEQSWRWTPPDFNIYYKATVMKSVVLVKKRKGDQWTRVESPERDPSKYSQLIFGKGAKEQRQ